MNEIFKEVKDVLEYTQEIDIKEHIINEIEEKFYENKKSFIDMMDGELSYTYPEKLTFEIPEEKKSAMFCNLVLDYRRILNHSNVDHETYENFINFICSCEENFFNNIVDEPYKDIVPKGMKITKAFKRFKLPQDILRSFQDQASMILQKNKISGYLTFSVNPLDFLTMSENNENWSSCMSIDGMYRRGILSYMLDNSTVICYLSDNEKEEITALNDTEFYSKKWRMLIHFSSNKNALYCSRQYPYYSSEILKNVKSKILDNFYGQGVLIDDFIETLGGSTRINDAYLNRITKKSYYQLFDVFNDNQYCDVQYITKQKPVYYLERKSKYWDHKYESDEKFTVGTSTPCLICGTWQEKEEENWCQYSMLCDECELVYGNCDDEETFARCYICGDVFLRTDDNYLYSGYESEPVCDYCLENKVIYCSKCGEPIVIDWENYVYDEETGEYLSKECSLEGEEEFNG